MREKQRTTHKSMLGKEIDMHKLSMQHEMTVAIGNAKVNARGDELGPGGKIIRKREELIREAMTQRPNENVARSAAPEPVVEQPTRTKTGRKNVDDMDPEGNE